MGSEGGSWLSCRHCPIRADSGGGERKETERESKRNKEVGSLRETVGEREIRGGSLGRGGKEGRREEEREGGRER